MWWPIIRTQNINIPILSLTYSGSDLWVDWMEWEIGVWGIKLGDFIGKTIYIRCRFVARWKVGFLLLFEDFPSTYSFFSWFQICIIFAWIRIRIKVRPRSGSVTNLLQCCRCGSVLDPYSGDCWIWIRIQTCKYRIKWRQKIRFKL